MTTWEIGLITRYTGDIGMITRNLSLIHTEPTRQAEISYAVFCLKKKKKQKKTKKTAVTYTRGTVLATNIGS